MSSLESVEQLPELVAWLQAILAGDENSTVTIDGQIKPSIQKTIADNLAYLKTMIQGRQPFATKALMEADLAHAENVIAEVFQDSVRANNGIYGKTGASGAGAWVKSPFDDYSELVANVTDLEKQAIDAPKKMAAAVVDAGVSAGVDELLNAVGVTDEIVGGIADDQGNAALLVTKLGEIIIPLLKLYDIKMGDVEATSGSHNYEMAVMDALNNVAFGVDTQTGATLMALAQVMGSLSVGDGSSVYGGEYNYDFAIVDEQGNVAAGFHNGYLISPLSNEVDNRAVQNQNNIVRAAEFKQKINTTHAMSEFDYNHIVVYGQSLSTGAEGWPVLSKTQDYGNLMLGDCVRPMNTNHSDFIPFGGDKLVPLIANVQSGDTILTDAAVTNLVAGDGVAGEVVNQGMVNFAKRLHNRDGLSVANNFVTTNSGAGGKTIEQLSKNNTQDSTDRYGRYLGAVQKIKAIADAEVKSYGVTCIVWMQGEWNYSNYGGAESLVAYKSALKTLRDDMVADAKATTGQKDAAVFITYQTGAAYTRDEDELGAAGLHVGMAQWEFARENADCVLAGPVYPYTDKGGHLDSNGYRWYGNYLGKIYHKVVTLGQSWSPLSPTKATLVGRELYVDFHVPEPPLVLDLPYVRNTGTDYTNKGFRVTDDSGAVIIRSVEIIEPTIVKITLSRDVGAGAKIWYASQATYGGNGCLRDSDDIVALDNYEYLPDSGMYDAANIPALNDKPYPLHNWCIAFCLPVNWSI